MMEPGYEPVKEGPDGRGAHVLLPDWVKNPEAVAMFNAMDSREIMRAMNKAQRERPDVGGQVAAESTHAPNVTGTVAAAPQDPTVAGDISTEPTTSKATEETPSVGHEQPEVPPARKAPGSTGDGISRVGLLTGLPVDPCTPDAREWDAIHRQAVERVVDAWCHGFENTDGHHLACMVMAEHARYFVDEADLIQRLRAELMEAKSAIYNAQHPLFSYRQMKVREKEAADACEKMEKLLRMARADTERWLRLKTIADSEVSRLTHAVEEQKRRFELADSMLGEVIGTSRKSGLVMRDREAVAQQQARELADALRTVWEKVVPAERRSWSGVPIANAQAIIDEFSRLQTEAQ